ncbi:MAG TPA: LEA type 2 family protein [Verrucomicrobiota bacterium]|nr:hypothetical protein [Verrucomicrobiales bacterium]HRI15708.1 LEA type 2 family protein [Verrucomicrobiota bacterium]
MRTQRLLCFLFFPPILLIALAALLMNGCATFQGEPPLDIMLSNVTPGQGGGVGDAPLNFVIRLENASPYPLTIEGGAYKVYLNDIYVGQGLSNETLQIDRLASATVSVPVHVSTFRLVGSLYSVLKSNQVSYRLAGSIYVKHDGRPKTYQATREGMVNLAEVQNTLGGANAQ